MIQNSLVSENNMTVLEILESMGEVTPGDLIPILQKVQDQYGFLPQDVLTDVSKHTSIPISRIYGVATFYEQFYLEPRGKHIIKCCRGTACYVRGGLTLIDSIKNELGVEEGETTEDFQFTFETVACLGTCALAPVMMVDDTYYGKMDSGKVKKLVAELRSEVKETA